MGVSVGAVVDDQLGAEPNHVSQVLTKRPVNADCVAHVVLEVLDHEDQLGNIFERLVELTHRDPVLELQTGR